MSNFRAKLFGLAAIVAASTGMSYGQVVSGCTSPNPAINVVVRAEGETELTSDPSVQNCTNTITATGSTVTLTLSSPVTSKAFTPVAPATGNTDAVLFVYPTAAPNAVPGTGATPATPYYGTVSSASPNVLTFTGVTLPAGPFSLGFSNVRVNAVGAAANQVTATPAIIYTSGNVASSVSGLTAENVAFIQQSLAPTALVPLNANSPVTVNNYTVCGGNLIFSAAPALNQAAFIISIVEKFTGAFKAQALENGSYVPGGGSTVGLATSPDQIVIALGNIPASATIYVPQVLTANGGTTLTLNNSTAVTSPAGLSATPNPNVLANQAPYVAFTPSNGGVTITYTVSGVSTAAATFAVPTYITFAPNSAAAQGPITINESYGPTGTVTGAAASVPTFTATSSPAINGSSILICQTSLLFPFVTNQLGFDTGVVITNASTDALGLGGKSFATPQTGTCTLSFFGTGAPSPATLVADPGGALPTASTHAFTISSVAPGFQGYVIATCPMLYIHGYAFISYNLTQNNGVAEGYVAPVLLRGVNGDAASF